MAADHFFEGTEKLLKISFRCQGVNDTCESGDLRKIPRDKFDKILKNVACKIISCTKNDKIDAYVLSESSMFITKYQFILKTCGTTTPLNCIQLLLHYVIKFTGFRVVDNVYYSRKNFEHPELQKYIYRNFKLEIQTLDVLLKKTGAGESMRSSKTQDSWYLYTLHPDICERNEKPNSEQTMELLMTQLNPNVMEIFTKEKSANAIQATKVSGISELIPNMIIDDFLFDPCGYSMNGISEEGHYMTIHITPQKEFSYVSFETNVPQNSYKELASKVLKTFQPKKFVLTMFTNKKSPNYTTHQKEFKPLMQLDDWRRDTNNTYSLNQHDLTVSFYSKCSN